jgi:hypothetical protein
VIPRSHIFITPSRSSTEKLLHLWEVRCKKEWLDEQVQQELIKAMEEEKNNSGKTIEIDDDKQLTNKFKKEFKQLLLFLVIGGVFCFLATTFELDIVGDSFQNSRRSNRHFNVDGAKQFAVFIAPYLLAVSCRIFKKSQRI